MTEQKRPVLTLKRKTEGGNTDPEPENHHQCHHATKMEGEKAETGGEGCPGSRADSKKSAGQTGAVHLSEPALAG